jgi:hypothetical protein
MRFQILTAASMKMTVFWGVLQCSLADVYRRFKGACCLHYQGDLMMKASTSEKSVKFYHTTRLSNPEDSHLHVLKMLNIPLAGNVARNLTTVWFLLWTGQLSGKNIQFLEFQIHG